MTQINFQEHMICWEFQRWPSINLNFFYHTIWVYYEQWHVISNNVAFLHVWTQISLYSLLLGVETPNDVQSVA